MHIPPHNMEIERIYTQVLAPGKRAIAITSANSGEGVTSVALAMAQRNLLAGHSTLVVDLNLHRPAFRGVLGLDRPATVNGLLDPPQLIALQELPVAVLGIPAPAKREAVMKLRNPGVLEDCIAGWQQEFDTVIFDTSPVNHVNASIIPPERVAAACEGSLMVVLAGHTTEAMVFSATEKMRAAGAQLLGCVLNDRDNPSLKDELLREVRRLEPRFGRMARHLGRWIKQNSLLSLEV
mgnify:CR=1 FL=1